MRRLAMVILALVLISGLIFAGCSNTPTTTSTSTLTSTTPTTTSGTTTSTSTTSTTTTTTSTSTAPAKTWNLKYSIEQAPTSYYYLYGHKPFADAIEKATNGVVKATIYDSQSLMKTAETWDGVKSGRADMGWIFTGLYSGKFSFAEASTLPFMFPNAAVGGQVTWEIFNKYPEIQAQWKDNKILATWTAEPYFMVSRSKFYKTPADFSNMKIRVPGGPPIDFIKAMGATPVTYPMPDCYMNLKNGVFDAMLIPAEAYMGFNIYQVAPYATYVPTINVYHAIAMNMDDWNSFPKAVQDQIMSVSGSVASVQFSGGVFDKARADLVPYVTKQGSTIQEYTLTAAEKQAWIDASRDVVWNKWIADQTAKGLTNAKAIVDDTWALSQKYTK
jgi:TRAP-type C4-dicarboxylate transport system substrate-binding protein